MEEVALDYTVKMDISRFDGELGGEVELIVRWVIFDRQGNIVWRWSSPDGACAKRCGSMDSVCRAAE